MNTSAISPVNYEKLGQFYLGKCYDIQNSKVEEEPLLYDSKDLVTHGVVLGMTGSGKTGLCLSILEEAAMDNIPAIVIDPKGDISNLLLLFPDMDAKCFRPWINEDEASKAGISIDEQAAKISRAWENGLKDWGQSPERIEALREKVDVTIFTPGSRIGIPVSILSSLSVPSVELLDDAELFEERVSSTVTSLLTLAGVDSEDLQSAEVILVGKIIGESWLGGQGVTLESLIREVQTPSFDKVGVMDLESFLPDKSRRSLAAKFNNLLASPSFATWLEGPPLDIDKMLHTPEGKPCISIFSIAHLSDPERMFFVTLLLNQMLGWMRTQKGTGSLRALLYMDEIFGYLPPTANPSSKRPMMTLLKQSRAFGLGCLLATQNPVDLDYKALSNIGTWFLGRLQTEQDKARLLDGLEGAGGKFDRAKMDKIISGLGKQVFVMNNIHEDGPVIFKVRWAMSYLAGPLSRLQIKSLMDPKRAKFLAMADNNSAIDSNSKPNGMPGISSTQVLKGGARPLLGAGILELFYKPVSPVEVIIYQPHLLRKATVQFFSSKMGVDGVRHVALVNPVLLSGIDSEHELTIDLKTVDREPIASATYGEVPGFAMNSENYKQTEKDFAEDLYRNQRAKLFHCEELNKWSGFDEEEANFRARLSHEAREARDAAVDKLRAEGAKKVSSVQSRLLTAQGQLTKEKSESQSAILQTGISVVTGILGGIFGRKLGMGSLTRGATSLSKATGAYKQHQDVGNAAAKIAGIEQEIITINADLTAQIEKISASYDPALLVLTSEVLKPAKTNIDVEMVALLWLPFDERGDQIS